MAFFPRQEPEEPGEPVDDAADFVVSARQAAIRRRADTRRQMVKVAEAIHASLAGYAKGLRWVSETDYQRGRRAA